MASAAIPHSRLCEICTYLDVVSRYTIISCAVERSSYCAHWKRAPIINNNNSLLFPQRLPSPLDTTYPCADIRSLESVPRLACRWDRVGLPLHMHPSRHIPENATCCWATPLIHHPYSSGSKQRKDGDKEGGGCAA